MPLVEVSNYSNIVADNEQDQSTLHTLDVCSQPSQIPPHPIQALDQQEGHLLIYTVPGTVGKARCRDIKYTAQRVYLCKKNAINTWIFKFIVAHDLEIIKQVHKIRCTIQYF